MSSALLDDLQASVRDRTAFEALGDFRTLAIAVLRYVEEERPTLIHAPRDAGYHFYQFPQAYGRNITRPIHTALWMPNADVLAAAFDRMLEVLADLGRSEGARASSRPFVRYAESGELRRTVYTVQQAIGCVGDSFTGTNQARKRIGQLFERLVLLLVREMRLQCESRTVRLPVPGDAGHTMSYELDFVVSRRGAALVGEAPLHPAELVGSAKTTSKDRIDKVFLDKHMMTRLLGRDVPVVGVFLHDVQRATRGTSLFGVASTFKRGHFLGYTAALTALDGVYFVDPRPEMVTDPLLSAHISGFERFLFHDVWRLTG